MLSPCCCCETILAFRPPIVASAWFRLATPLTMLSCAVCRAAIVVSAIVLMPCARVCACDTTACCCVAFDGSASSVENPSCTAPTRLARSLPCAGVPITASMPCNADCCVDRPETSAFCVSTAFCIAWFTAVVAGAIVTPMP